MDADAVEAPKQTAVARSDDYYVKYESASDIHYTPEKCLTEAGLGMVKTIKKHVNRLELGSKLRKDVWLKEIAKYATRFPPWPGNCLQIILSSLESQSSPKTLIAVCGATGAGKSSILNAILDGMLKVSIK